MHNLFWHGFSESNVTWVVKSIAEVRTAERTFKAQFFSKEKSSWKENLPKWTLFSKEKSSWIKNLLERKIFLKEKSSWKKNLERNRNKFCWKKLEGYKNIYIISNNWQGMTNVTKSTPPSQKIIVYLWRPPPSYLLFPKNFNR